MADAATTPGPPLLERGRELRALAGAARAAAGGAGRLVVVEGPAGIGKTALLRGARAVAEDAGLRTLSARGAELEREFAFGAVRQLLEGPVHDGSPELLAGPAALAGPLLGASAAPPAAREASYAVVHGLYWVTVHLAREGPLALLVDDVHWLDASSLRWLAYLAARLDALPVLLVAATRSDEPGGTALRPETLREATVLRPRPLSEPAARRLVRAALPAADAEVCRACHAASAGNPLFLRALIRAVGEAGLEQAAAVLDRAPPDVRAAVAARVARLPPAARTLARGVAVLGPAPVRRAAALVGLELADAAGAADALAAAGLLDGGRPARFAHPIVRAALLDGMSAGERAAAHAHAARLLAAEDAPAEQVAAHLLQADPAGDRWACAALADAARRALERGAPEAAIAYLRRALDEPPDAAARPETLLQLGLAEGLAFQATAAMEHLRRAVETHPEPEARLRAALVLGSLLGAADDLPAAAALLDQTLDGAQRADPALLGEIEGQLLHFALSDPRARAIVARRAATLRDRVAAGAPGGPARLSSLAAIMAMGAEPADEVAAVARRALAAQDGTPAEPADMTVPFIARCLLAADRLDEALAALDPAVAGLRERGAGPVAPVPLLVFRAEALLRAGRVAEAQHDARQALAGAVGGWRLGVPAALAVLVRALVERGAAAEALRALAAHDLDVPAADVPPAYPATMALHARGEARLAAGDAAGAADDLLACGTRVDAIGEVNPALLAWRSGAARALAALGERARARELAAEELALARRFGAPRAVSVALRAAAAIATGDPVAPLREAVALTRGSPARLEHGHALAQLGGALLDAGARADACAALEDALDLAHRCGARALEARARGELRRAGRRPRRAARTGPAALTAAERRVAQLAAQGATNRAIAARLVVTERTVEYHLTAVYRKLGISSRRELGPLFLRTAAENPGVDGAAPRE